MAEGVGANAGWQLRPFQPGDEAAVLELFHLAFGAKPSADHFRWKYHGNPAGSRRLLAFTRQGDLVGHVGGLLRAMRYGNTEILALLVVDVMTHPHHRGQLRRRGLLVSLMAEFLARYAESGQVDVVYGFPGPIHARLGQLTLDYPLLQRIVAFTKPLGSRLPLRRGAPLRFRLTRPARFDERANALWARTRGVYPCLTTRTAAYLNWRYAGCPDRRYDLWQLEHRLSGRLAAYAVTRLLDGTLYVVDWLADPAATPSAREHLLQVLEHAGAELQAREIHLWAPTPTGLPVLLSRQGYAPQETPFTLAARAYSPRVDIAWFQPRFYYLMGEIDVF